LGYIDIWQLYTVAGQFIGARESLGIPAIDIELEGPTTRASPSAEPPASLCCHHRPPAVAAIRGISAAVTRRPLRRPARFADIA
jgi:hypothetical protein